MNPNLTDIAIKTEDAKEKILDLIPFKDKDEEDNEWRYDFHVYLLEFLSQTIVINDDLIVKISENLFSYNFGLLCHAAVNNISFYKDDYLFFTPKAQIDLLGESKSFYDELKKEYTPWLIYKLYGSTSEENFKELMSYDWENLANIYMSKKGYKQYRSNVSDDEHKMNVINKQKLCTASMFMVPFVQFGDTIHNSKKHVHEKHHSQKTREYLKDICSDCGGEGKVEEIPGMNYWKDCKKCNGTGEERKPVLHDNEVYCDACDGFGKVDYFKRSHSDLFKNSKNGYIDTIFGKIKFAPLQPTSGLRYWQKCTKCDGSGIRKKRTF